MQSKDTPEQIIASALGHPPMMDDADLCELATEAPDGPLAALHALLDGLAIRFAEEPAALAAVIAARHYHLPRLIDSLAE